VPPRYFYRRDGNRLTLKTKDQPEFQLIECLRALGIETAGEVRRIPLNSEQTATGQTLWEIVRTPVGEEEHFRDATNVSVHRSASSGSRERERRVGVFFEVEFEEPVALQIPAIGHSCHFGLGLFAPVTDSTAAQFNKSNSEASIRNPP
jgi:CRISPR-associated protein Csb2